MPGNAPLPIPEFKPSPIEVWSSVGLTALLIIVSTYASWMSASFGASASFHITHGIIGSWTAFCGVGISVLAAILAWKGFGLNAVAALLGASSLASTLMGADLFRPSLSFFAAVGLLVAAIHYTRRYFEHNPFLTFLGLWGLTFASSLAQSLFYRILTPSYPLQGALLLNLAVFGVGGLTMLFAHPQTNKEYVI